MGVTGMFLSSLSFVCISCRGGSSQMNGTFCSCNSRDSDPPVHLAVN